jgi:predicted dienelactone hydrolase
LAPPAALSYPSPDQFDSGLTIAPLLPTVSGTPTAYSVSPTLPAGLRLDAHNGDITGMPSQASAQAHYLVTAANTSGSTNFDLALSVRAPQDTGTTYPIGFEIVQLPSGLKAAIWYPAVSGPGQSAYPAGLASDFTYFAAPLTTQRWPLVLYSHGDLGCAYQSVFINEALARHGYVVAAMDHVDSTTCSLDGGPVRGPDPVIKPAYERPELWDDTTVVGRRNDVRSLADYMLGTEPWRSLIDAQAVGLAGYSLGGYTALGLLGGRGSWYDPRFRAALLMAPYTAPYLVIQSMAQVRTPLMFLAGADDGGMTPYMRGPVSPFSIGSYDAANPAKYYVEFGNADHFAWSTQDCPGAPSVAACVQAVPRKQVMAAYAVAFFEHALRGIDEPLLRTQDPAVVALRYTE